MNYVSDRNSVQSWGGVDRRIELMPKSCPTELVAGRPKDKMREGWDWEMEKRGGEEPSQMCQKEEKSKGRTNDNLLEKI